MRCHVEDVLEYNPKTFCVFAGCIINGVAIDWLLESWCREGVKTAFLQVYQFLFSAKDEVGDGVDGEEAAGGFGFGCENTDGILVVDEVV